MRPGTPQTDRQIGRSEKLHLHFISLAQSISVVMLAAATRAAALSSSLRPVINRQRLLVQSTAIQTGRTYASSSKTPPPQQPQEPPSSKDDSIPSSSESIPEQPSSASSQDAAPKNRSTSAFDIDTTLMAIADEAADGKEGGKGGRTGARARSDAQQSSIERQRKTTRRIFALMGLAGAGVMLGNLSRDWDTVEERTRFKDVSSKQCGRTDK